MADNFPHPYKRRWVLTIDDLSDDDLLEIFDFYVVRYQDLGFRGYIDHNTKREIESWQLLVHVCRRWRSLVFGSALRLNLQLYYEPEKSARKSLDIWPALPLLLIERDQASETSVDDIIARLEHSDRIRHIDLNCSHGTSSQFTALWPPKLLTAMKVPFPELAGLYMSIGYWLHESVPCLPDSFLGGSAPRLRYFYLNAIPFPGLPNLLLSATHLVNLHLHNIPHSGYISPEAMATCLSMLTSLETFQLQFVDSLSYPDLKSRRPFPPTRSVLPTLTSFSFLGLNEYLEEFVARIDAPQLYHLSTALLNHIDFDTPELNQFIGRTPILGAYDEAHLILDGCLRVRLRQFQPERSDHRMVEVGILSGRQVSILAKICTLSLRPLLTMVNLHIDMNLSSPLVWEDDIENTKWLDLLLPFTAVKNLYLSKPISPRIALALQELTGGRATEVLPALQNVFLDEFPPPKPVQEGIARFISARQLTNHPIAITVWHGVCYDEEDWEFDD